MRARCPALRRKHAVQRKRERDMPHLPVFVNLVPKSRRLLRIIWPFLAIVVLLLVLWIISMDILSATRAYVGGESLWSKAQKDAVFYLNRYGTTHSETDYERYQDAIRVPLGDRKAREELDQPNPNLERAREGFVEGRNHPDDIADMIWLFRRFRNVAYIDRAIAIWAHADARIAELTAAAERLHQRVTAGNADEEGLRPLLEEVRRINGNLTPLEDAFSFTLGEASRRMQLVLTSSTLIVAAFLVMLGIILSRRMLSASEEFENAL